MTLWLVVLVLEDDEDELFELVCEALLVDDESFQSSALAVLTWARPTAETRMQRSSAKQRGRGFTIGSTIGHPRNCG